ncbi:type IV pilus biogenesis/stability protein PilW [Alkalimonas delamerensis]|uniref:Type IV pilus biogenesis/stability protein PilW n=1 Tax=Alkalimonas delamerensis TaxID=265981 RepID=A0ABT9GLW4_9GAMM|nr:type IV pilus biogenesis/stability protein PilW [Alkalimonas delamerensis]MDP4527919.1 type IV pilus biogenesis/stability protein PilW [Alkalimonas delamerensis]
MQKLSVSMVVVSALVLSGCVSESTYVGSDRPVQQRQVDNTEAARTRMSLGLNYLQRGENAQAIFNLERARALAPQLPEVYNALAFYYQNVNEPEQAEAAYKQALARDPDNADTYNNYGAFLCQQGKYDEAEHLLLTAIRRPGYMRVSESYENLALCQLQQNNFSRAQRYLESAVLHSGNRISSLLNLAGLDYAMGNHQRARQHLTRIQRLGHVSADSILLSYLLADKELDQETQQNSRELLLQVYPDSEAARLLRQNRLQDSEFEQLRERYKQYLIANLEMPESVAERTAEPEQPQIRIVRRQPAQTEPPPAVRSESLTRTRRDSRAVEPAQSPREAVKEAVARHETSSIAASLSQPLPLPEVNAALVSLPQQDAAAVGSELAASEVEEVAPIETVQFRQPPAVPVASEHAALRFEPELSPDTEIRQRIQQSLNGLLAVPKLEVTSLSPGLQADADAMIAESEIVTDETVEPDYAAENELYAAGSVHSETFDTFSTQPESNSPEYEQRNAEMVQSEEPPYHRVQQGESLFAISMKYNIRLERLQQWNRLSPGDSIRVGRRLWLAEPPPEPELVATVAEVTRPDYHIIAEGDTLFSISMRYNVRLARLLEWNNLTERSRVYLGQRIYLIDPAQLTHDN